MSLRPPHPRVPRLQGGPGLRPAARPQQVAGSHGRGVLRCRLGGLALCHRVRRRRTGHGAGQSPGDRRCLRRLVAVGGAPRPADLRGHPDPARRRSSHIGCRRGGCLRKRPAIRGVVRDRDLDRLRRVHPAAPAQLERPQTARRSAHRCHSRRRGRLDGGWICDRRSRLDAGLAGAGLARVARSHRPGGRLAADRGRRFPVCPPPSSRWCLCSSRSPR